MSAARMTIDNLDGLGAVDYSAAIDRSTPFTIERVLNAPSVLNGLLCLAATTLSTPSRRGRIVVANHTGTTLFTGYLTTEPEAVYAGAASGGPQYRLAFSAVSDEWLLDKQAALPLAGAGLGQPSGPLLVTLMQRSGGGAFATTGVAAGMHVGVFHPEPAAAWSVNAGRLASGAYGAYRIVDAAASLTTAGSTVHALTDGDGTLTIAALKTAAVRELANDVTLSGDVEPTAYVTELFEGDGTTTVFELEQAPFVAKAADRKLIDESFNQAAIDTATWLLSDAGNYLSLGGSGLLLGGGNGSDGQTTLAAIDPVELGGSLLMELGNVSLTGASSGVLGGFYTGATERANCFAGYNVRQSGGATLLVPLVDGVEAGTPLTMLSGHSYALRIRLHAVEMERVAQVYYAMVDGAVQAFGGGLYPAAVAIVMDVLDLGAASNTPATVLYDGTIAGAIAGAPALGTFVPVDSIGLTGSIGSIQLTQTGSAWVTSTPPGGVCATRLIGIAGEGADCKVASSGSVTGKVTFFAGRIPVAGELITVGYRARGRAVARLENAASVAAEVAGGAPGTARWLGHVVSPEARSSADCENAAAAVLSFACARAAAVAGTYTAIDPAADIWPGDLLDVTANGASLSLMVRRVTVEDHGACPERVTYRIAFANDWAEGLGLKLSETIAADALLPATALTAPAMVLANLQGLTVSAATASALSVDAGTAPPAGGGFEVRRRDGNFGPQVDQDLVLRSPVRGFTIPRASVEEQFFVRMYDASSPPLYSRCSAEIVTHLAI